MLLLLLLLLFPVVGLPTFLFSVHGLTVLVFPAFFVFEIFFFIVVVQVLIVAVLGTFIVWTVSFDIVLFGKRDRVQEAGSRLIVIVTFTLTLLPHSAFYLVCRFGHRLQNHFARFFVSLERVPLGAVHESIVPRLVAGNKRFHFAASHCWLLVVILGGREGGKGALKGGSDCGDVDFGRCDAWNKQTPLPPLIMAPVQDQNQVEDPFTATIALLETHRAAGNRSLSRSEPLRKLAAFLKTRIEAPPSDEIIDPRLETVTKLVDAFLKQESTNSEWTETVKLACSVRIRGLVLELRAKGLGQAEAHSRILQLIEDPTWTSLARLCIIRAALVELGTWCSSELEGEGEGEGKGQDHARLMFAHIAAAVEDRTDGHPLFRTIALDNLTVFIKRHKLSREERVKSFGKLFYEIVWAPTAHDTTGSNRSMVKAATEALILSLWDSDEAVARELLLTSAARTMGPRGDASRVPLWANVLPLIGSRGLVEAARLSSMDIPAEASDDKVVGLLWAYLAKVAIEDRLASARVSDAAEAFLETMWKEETTGFGPTEIAQAADKWATKWLPSVLAAFPSISVGDDPEADEKMDHIVTVLDERILRHASNQGVQATAALVRQLDTLFPNDERSMTCSLMFLKRLNEKEMDTLVPLLPAQDPIAMVRNASVHPSKMVKMQAMAVLVQMRRTFPDGLADFVRANLLDIPVLYSESFWKFLAKWTNGLQKTVAKSVPGLRRLAMDTLSRPSADPRRKTIGLKILGIIGFDPSEKLLVPTLLNVVSRDLLEVNRTMACDLLVGFEGEGSDAVFTAQKSVIEFERWVVYAKLLLAHRRALERLRGAMLIRWVCLSWWVSVDRWFLFSLSFLEPWDSILPVSNKTNLSVKSKRNPAKTPCFPLSTP